MSATLTPAERAEIRARVGYPANPPPNRGHGFAAHQAHGAMEYRLGSLSESEVVKVRAMLADGADAADLLRAVTMPVFHPPVAMVMGCAA